ncbi:MAG: leucyl/phenylalanyl-tRNA--protein transferase [Bacteroidia bacterium]|nr:leucyl/phenylalanyl-tRNA--protein transferase [Bacteroidia bacterium]
MPVYGLTEELIFPPPHLSNRDGILAVGGDLSPERLLLAYSMGIFPWYSEEDPIIWWSPNPRLVLYPSDLKISRSMRPVFNQGKFIFTTDQAFREIISSCRQSPRKGQRGTWITDEMLEAYCLLHEEGFAHSLEVWEKDNIVAGLYGVSLGSCFFGESMFTRVSNGSKAGFIYLVQELEKRGYDLIDCQVYTDHLSSMGAVEVPRKKFLTQLENSLKKPTWRGKWLFG